MVIMEYLQDGVSLWRNREDPSRRRPVPGTVLEDVRNALDLLHENGWVFGDVRDANVVWYKGRGFLFDFDWAGRKGEDRYPAEVCVHAITRKIHA